MLVGGILLASVRARLNVKLFKFKDVIEVLLFIFIILMFSNVK